jgi:GDP/UDP-N,N'-diacetylbacillosamine 2-epimerase (hydrolysing)
LEESLGMPIDKNVALVTFHPVTTQKGRAREHIGQLLTALGKSGMKIVFTMPNSDAEHGHIFNAIERFVHKKPGLAKAFRSLGQQRYFSLLKYAGLMVGNSSSGVVEAASFSIPVVNIGDRQKGRIMPANVVNSGHRSSQIISAIKRARSRKMAGKMAGMKNNFEGKNASRKIKNALKRVVL